VVAAASSLQMFGTKIDIGLASGAIDVTLTRSSCSCRARDPVASQTSQTPHSFFGITPEPLHRSGAWRLWRRNFPSPVGVGQNRNPTRRMKVTLIITRKHIVCITRTQSLLRVKIQATAVNGSQRLARQPSCEPRS